MRYVKMWAETEYAGTEDETYEAYPDGTTDAEIDDDLENYAHSIGEDYEYLATGWDEGFESEEEADTYYANIDSGWMEISEEEYREAVNLDT